MQIMQLLAQRWCAKYPSEPLAWVTATPFFAVEDVQLPSLRRAFLAEYARQSTGAEYAAVTATETEETSTGSVTATVTTGKYLRDKTRGKGTVTDEDIAQRRDAATQRALLE